MKTVIAATAYAAVSTLLISFAFQVNYQSKKEAFANCIINSRREVVANAFNPYFDAETFTRLADAKCNDI